MTCNTGLWPEISNYMITTIILTTLLDLGSNSTALVEWGAYLGSTVGERLSTVQRALYVISNIPPYYLGIIVGLLLSDGCLVLKPKAVNVLLQFCQSTKHSPYFWSVFNVLSPFCPSIPYFTTHLTKGVECFSLRFYTRSLPFFTTLYPLFNQ